MLAASLALAFVAAGIMGSGRLALGEARPSEAAPFGTGTTAVVSPTDVTSLAFDLDPTNPARVTSVTLKFAENLSAESIVCVQALSDALLILANRCLNPLGADLAAKTAITLTFDATPSQTVSAAAITAVSVTVIQPVAPIVDGPNGIEVVDVEWTLDPDDSRLVEEVKVTLAGVTKGEKLKIHMTLKDDPGGGLLQRVTGLSTLPASAPNSGIVAVTWDLTTEGATPPLVGPVSAKAITRFDIQITPDK